MLIVVDLLEVVGLTLQAPGSTVRLLGLQSAGLGLPGLRLLLQPVVVQDVPLDHTSEFVDVKFGGDRLFFNLFLF